MLLLGLAGLNLDALSLSLGREENAEWMANVGREREFGCQGTI